MTESRVSFHTQPVNAKKLLPNIKGLHLAQTEAERREARFGKMAFYQTETSDQQARALLTMPGTVTVFIANQQNPLMDQIRQAIAKEDPQLTGKVLEQLKKQFSNRSTMPLARATALLKKAPVFGEIRYKNLTIARHLFAGDQQEVCVVTLPYTGLALQESDLTLVEYVTDPNATLDVIFFAHGIALSEAEKVALERVSPVGLGGMSPVAGPCDADLVEVVVMVLLYALLAKPADFGAQHLAQDRISQIGANATARELLFLRRQLLKGQ